MNMMFLNSSQNIQHNQSNQNQSNLSVPNMIARRRFIRPLNVLNQAPVIQNPIIENPKPKMIWGPPIWFLFHTLAEKIKPESFSTIIKELLNNINIICSNLPCPICSTHAKEYMGKINFNSIRSKQDLKKLLFDFHNTVNSRKGYTIFTKEELDSKYSNSNTVNIIHNFIIHFKDKHRSPKLIADDLMRQRIAANLQIWFQNNITAFEL
jgi:hypothetical protein